VTEGRTRRRFTAASLGPPLRRRPHPTGSHLRRSQPTARAPDPLVNAARPRRPHPLLLQPRPPLIPPGRIRLAPIAAVLIRQLAALLPSSI
jgi:hypothetical protein